MNKVLAHKRPEPKPEEGAEFANKGGGDDLNREFDSIYARRT
jgi:hypothetical protein